MSGFAAIYREVRDHPLFKGNPDRLGAWVWLLLTACWKETPFDIAGKITTLERGQLCTSRNVLAREWNWSPSAVERFLTRLETEQMIGRATGQGRSIITICNYEKYQSPDGLPGQATGQATGQPSDKQRTTKEQGNKGTREPNGSPTPLPPKAKMPTRMPRDWQPKLGPKTQALVDQWPDGKLERELRKFTNHAADKGRTSKDWNAAFRTWLENADEWMKRDDRSEANRRNSSGDQRDDRDHFARAIDDVGGFHYDRSDQPAEAPERYATGPGGDGGEPPSAEVIPFFR